MIVVILLAIITFIYNVIKKKNIVFNSLAIVILAIITFLFSNKELIYSDVPQTIGNTTYVYIFKLFGIIFSIVTLGIIIKNRKETNLIIMLVLDILIGLFWVIYKPMIGGLLLNEKEIIRQNIEIYILMLSILIIQINLLTSNFSIRKEIEN